MDREHRSTSFIGEKLRQERLRKRISLQEVSDATRISERFLVAIEAGDTANIPGGFFAKSFIRQYAKFLGIHDETFEDQISESIPTQRSLPNPPDHLNPQGREPAPLFPFGGYGTESKRSSPMSLAVLLLAIIGCSALYMLWQRGREDSVAAGGPATRIGATQEAVSPEAQRGAPTGAAPAAPQTRPGAEPVPSPAQPSPYPAPAAPSPPASPVHVILSATEEVWVRATSDGRTIFAATLQAGDSRTVEAQERTLLVVGNAGGLEVTWNGKPLGPVGPRGQVRLVEFMPERYGFVARTSPES